MAPKLFNVRKTDQSTTQEGSKKLLHGEIREITSALTHHLGELHNLGKSSSVNHHEADDEQGMRIITLAGSNTGATMKGDLDEASGAEDDEVFKTYTNSNFQAINNSIMYGGSYTCKDPGVHIETCMDYKEPDKRNAATYGKKGKKKVRGTSRSDQHSPESSDGHSE